MAASKRAKELPSDVAVEESDDEIRERYSMSQSRAAELLGVTSSAVNKMRNRGDLSSRTFEGLPRYDPAEVDELLQIRSNGTAAQSSAMAAATQHARELMALLQRFVTDSHKESRETFQKITTQVSEMMEASVKECAELRHENGEMRSQMWLFLDDAQKRLREDAEHALKLEQRKLLFEEGRSFIGLMGPALKAKFFGAGAPTQNRALAAIFGSLMKDEQRLQTIMSTLNDEERTALMLLIDSMAKEEEAKGKGPGVAKAGEANGNGTAGAAA